MHKTFYISLTIAGHLASEQLIKPVRAVAIDRNDNAFVAHDNDYHQTLAELNLEHFYSDDNAASIVASDNELAEVGLDDHDDPEIAMINAEIARENITNNEIANLNELV